MKNIGLIFLAAMLSLAECRSAETSKGKGVYHPKAVRVDTNVPIQGLRHPKVTLVKEKAFPSPINWKAQPDPNTPTDPFFKNPIHKSKWYSHLLKCLDVDSSLMKEYPLPSG